MTRETSDCEARKPLAFDCNLRIARVLFGISIENKSLSAVSLSLVSSEPLEFEFALVFFDAAAAAVSALVFLVAVGENFGGERKREVVFALFSFLGIWRVRYGRVSSHASRMFVQILFIFFRRRRSVNTNPGGTKNVIIV